MKGMLKVELFKFFHSYSLWIILGVLVAVFCSLSTHLFVSLWQL